MATLMSLPTYRKQFEMTRPLCEIATEIRSNWAVPNYGAVPYLEAMSTMGDIDAWYFEDSGRSIVAYFLSNATSWRGDVARRVKAELKSAMK